MTETSPSNRISREELKELEIFRVIRPYIARCLSLNHDINNSLAGVIGYCEFLLGESDQLSEGQREYLGQILICGERIRIAVESLCREKIALDSRIDVAEAIRQFEKPPKGPITSD